MRSASGLFDVDATTRLFAKARAGKVIGFADNQAFVGLLSTLLLLRDMIFADRRHFRELLTGLAEGISPAVLADRLKRMQARGLIRREEGRLPGQTTRYSLTEQPVTMARAAE